MKITKKLLNEFEKAIKAWDCSEEDKVKDPEFAKCYAKDRKDLTIALNLLKAGKIEEASKKIYWLDTIVRDQVPQKLYNLLP